MRDTFPSEVVLSIFFKINFLVGTSESYPASTITISVSDTLILFLINFIYFLIEG